MKYRVPIEQDEDGVFVTRVPSLPGSISQGKDAVDGHHASLEKHDKPVPPAIDEETGRRIREFWKGNVR